MKTASFIFALVTIAFAQQPTIDNAKLEAHNFSGTIASQISQLGTGPYWVAWSEPIIAGQHNDVCSWNRGGNYYDSGRTPGAPVRLEGETALVLLVRVENGLTSELRISSPDCHLDAGGMPFYWLNNVPPAESIAWLKAQASARQSDTSVMSIALHRDAAADQALDDLAATTQPVELRKRAATWLGTARGAHGVATLKRMLATDTNPDVRDRAVLALSQSKDPGGIPLVIEAARNDKDAHIRGQALMWLAQRAVSQASSKTATDTIQSAIANDPDSAVRDRAVVALSQLPNGDGVPMLIDLAKNHRDASVRKKAMTQLGQSKDPRALDFFAQVLTPGGR